MSYQLCRADHKLKCHKEVLRSRIHQISGDSGAVIFQSGSAGRLNEAAFNSENLEIC